MNKKVMPQRKRLAAVFASLSILVIGSMSLFESMSIDYYSVVATLQRVIPASIIMGGLGWVMGMILDKPKKKGSSIGYSNSFLNNIIKETQAAETSLEDLEKEASTLAPEVSENSEKK